MPQAHTLALARARAASSRSSIGSPIESNTRQAVGVEATCPKRSGCCRNVARSAMHSPPSARVTARSTSTRAGSCRRRRFASGASAFESPWSSPLRSASSANSRLPA